jgi:hypothetical protein
MLIARPRIAAGTSVRLGARNTSTVTAAVRPRSASRLPLRMMAMAQRMMSGQRRAFPPDQRARITMRVSTFPNVLGLLKRPVARELRLGSPLRSGTNGTSVVVGGKAHRIATTAWIAPAMRSTVTSRSQRGAVVRAIR